MAGQPAARRGGARPSAPGGGSVTRAMRPRPLPSPRGAKRRALARLAALALLVAPLGACSSFSGWFGSDNVQIPEDPADKLYNEGLYLLNSKKDYKAAGKRFE